MFRFTGDITEMSYPFIYEQSGSCDFEILTDELCTVTGLAGSACPAEHADIQAVLFALQPKIFDLNGSIRGKCAISDDDIEQLKAHYDAFRALLPENQPHFVLPRGTGVVVPLHYCRSLAKKATRALVQLDASGADVPATLPRYCNVLTNLYFMMTRVINTRAGIAEPEYISNNYPQRARKS